METMNQFEEAAKVAPPTTKKARGRPPKPLDPVKVQSFMAALKNTESNGVSSSHLAQVSGMDRSEVMSLLKSLIKKGEVVKTGAKKGSKYNSK